MQSGFESLSPSQLRTRSSMVEQATFNRKVLGSSPGGFTNTKGYNMWDFLGFIFSSYHSNRKAFILEAISTPIFIYACVLMTFTADKPNMTLLFPIFLLSCTLNTVAAYLRKLIWPVIMGIFVCVMDIIGYFVSLG